jgi:hypothetical protein
MEGKPTTEFERAARRQASPGFLRELWDYLRTNKKWWLLPLVAILLLYGAVLALSGSAAAPFIYPLF